MVSCWGNRIFPARGLLTSMHCCTLEPPPASENRCGTQRAAGDPEEVAQVLVGTQELSDIWMQVTSIWSHFESCPHCPLANIPFSATCDYLP